MIAKAPAAFSRMGIIRSSAKRHLESSVAWRHLPFAGEAYLVRRAAPTTANRNCGIILGVRVSVRR
jgi:hypothetical protein